MSEGARQPFFARIDVSDGWRNSNEEHESALDAGLCSTSANDFKKR